VSIVVDGISTQGSEYLIAVTLCVREALENHGGAAFSPASPSCIGREGPASAITRHGTETAELHM
jgi:hypothetical protein